MIQVQIDLLFGLNLHTTSEMKYFLKKIFYLVHTNTLGPPSVQCAPPPKKELNFFADKPPAEAKSEEAGQ